jgi:hypothetical protein
MVHTTAELAAEYWKLLQAFKRSIAFVPEQARGRFEASARYAESRLGSILVAESMQVLSFDGMPFDARMPAVAVNGDDVTDGDSAIVERTLEPAILQDMVVLMSGKVFLAKQNDNGEK